MDTDELQRHTLPNSVILTRNSNSATLNSLDALSPASLFPGEQIVVEQTPVSYPHFKHEWCADLFAHYLLHRRKRGELSQLTTTLISTHFSDEEVNDYENDNFDLLDLEMGINIQSNIDVNCTFCQINSDDLCAPLTVDGYDPKLHELSVEIITTAVVKRMLRTLFEHFHKQCTGSSTVLLQKGQLTMEQSIELLQEWPEEKYVQSEAEYIASCDHMLSSLLAKYNIRIDILLLPTRDPSALSITEQLLDLPPRVAQYCPLVEQTVQFKVIANRYERLCPAKGSRLPEKDHLHLADATFLLHCCQLNGLVAVNPFHLLGLQSGVLATDANLYLTNYKGQKLIQRYETRLQSRLAELRSLFDVGDAQEQL